MGCNNFGTCCDLPTVPPIRANGAYSHIRVSFKRLASRQTHGSPNVGRCLLGATVEDKIRHGGSGQCHKDGDNRNSHHQLDECEPPLSSWGSIGERAS